MGIYPLNAAVNAFVYLTVPVGLQLSNGVDPRDDVLTCATEIRKSLEKLKDPRLIEDMVTDLAQVQSQAAWNKGSQDPSKEGYLFMNITRRWVLCCPSMNRVRHDPTVCRLDWRSPHFGHPGKTRFHGGQPLYYRYVKVAVPNPKFVDGVWVSREGEIEGTLYVPHNRRKRLEILFERYAKGFGMTGSVEFLP